MVKCISTCRICFIHKSIIRLSPYNLFPSSLALHINSVVYGTPLFHRYEIADRCGNDTCQRGNFHTWRLCQSADDFYRLTSVLLTFFTQGTNGLIFCGEFPILQRFFNHDSGSSIVFTCEKPVTRAKNTLFRRDLYCHFAHNKYCKKKEHLTHKQLIRSLTGLDMQLYFLHRPVVMTGSG
ncbi:hypothetical protein Pgin02_00736 [Porphyromonas gingivalis]